MTLRDLPPCGRCGQPASHGFGRPGGLRSDWPDLGTLHACAEHAEAAERVWRDRYGIREDAA